MRIINAVLWGLVISSAISGCQILPEPLRESVRRPFAVQDGFIRVDGTQFVKNGKRYHFLGVNYPQAALLATSEEGKKRLARDLDQLAELGIKNLRVMVPLADATGERTVGSAQSEPTASLEQRLAGIDFLLREVRGRKMHAVLILGRSFRSLPSEEQNEDFLQAVDTIISRENRLTGLTYRQDPSIMAWQLPGVVAGDGLDLDSFQQWVETTAQYVKSLDSNHLVSSSAERIGRRNGDSTGGSGYGSSPATDYVTFQLWPEIWGWFDAEFPQAAYSAALVNAKAYILQHLQQAQELNKPAVLDAFGIARDRGDHRAGVASGHRDDFFVDILAMIETQARLGNAMAGSNLSALIGLDWRRQLEGGSAEEFELTSILDLDQFTLRAIRAHADAINSMAE